MELTAENVNSTLAKLLFTDEELVNGNMPANAVLVKGITVTFGFHPERVEMAKENIASMLDQLDPKFKEGWSFLNACTTKDSIQWGEHREMDALFCLGLATNKVELLMSRDLWHMLPGGMPYYKVL